jgi:hypothetical protein
LKYVIGTLVVLVGFLVLFSDNIAYLINDQQRTVDKPLQQGIEEQQKILYEMQNQQRLFEEFLAANDIEEQQRIFNEIQNQQLVDNFNQWIMEEATKSVTPFDEGGYVQGYGFNPSDTMAEDAHRMTQEQQMLQQQMNDMNNFNNFGNGMGF